MTDDRSTEPEASGSLLGDDETPGEQVNDVLPPGEPVGQGGAAANVAGSAAGTMGAASDTTGADSAGAPDLSDDASGIAAFVRPAPGTATDGGSFSGGAAGSGPDTPAV